MKIIQTISTLLIAGLITACSGSQAENELTSDLLEITSDQFQFNQMELGAVDTHTFESVVKCKGLIIPLKEGLAQVSAPVGGTIKRLYQSNGDYVSKGAPLIEIGGNDIVDLQKEYAEASAVFKRVESEYLRVKTLYDEDVISQKDYNLIKSEYLSSQARFKGLQLKIDALELSSAKIESGELYSYYTIKSPIQGQVINLKNYTGSNIENKDLIMEIVNPDLIQIELYIFPDNVSGIKVGQRVKIRSSDSRLSSEALIKSIGRVVDKERRSINCYASLRGSGPVDFILNQLVDSEVITGTENFPALPKEAILKSDSGTFVLILIKKEDNKYIFTKKEVKIGIEQNGFVQVVGDGIDGPILTKGGYNLF